MKDLILEYQWEIFIVAEIVSFSMLLLFGLLRYVWNQRRISTICIFLFIGVNIFEAGLAWYIFNHTGEIGTFQVIITIFLLYACTFGISDFKKLDRWMRKTIGKWRNQQLLTEEEIALMVKQKDPKYIIKKELLAWSLHLVVFLAVQLGFIMYSLGSLESLQPYLTDLSWYGSESVEDSPYANELMLQVTQVWFIVLVVDTIWSWSQS